MPVSGNFVFTPRPQVERAEIVMSDRPLYSKAAETTAVELPVIWERENCDYLLHVINEMQGVIERRWVQGVQKDASRR